MPTVNRGMSSPCISSWRIDRQQQSTEPHTELTEQLTQNYKSINWRTFTFIVCENTDSCFQVLGSWTETGEGSMPKSTASLYLEEVPRTSFNDFLLWILWEYIVRISHWYYMWLLIYDKITYVNFIVIRPILFFKITYLTFSSFSSVVVRGWNTANRKWGINKKLKFKGRRKKK